ncbi:general transcription repressor, partial [Ceratobasidium sp. 392]
MQTNDPHGHSDEGSLGSVDPLHSPSATPSPTNSAFPDAPLEPVLGPELFDDDGWPAIPNPEAKRTLDVGLTLTLPHQSVFVHEATAETGEPPYIRSVCFSPDSKHLATGTEDDRLRVWDVETKQIHKYLDGHTNDIFSLEFSPDGRLIVSGSADGTIRVWDVETDQCKVLRITESSADHAGVTSVAISPDGQLVAGGSCDGVVRIWEIESGALVERPSGHGENVYSVAFMPDGRGLVSGSLDQSVKLWDLSGFLSNPHWNEPLPQGENVSSWTEGGKKGSVCKTSFSGHWNLVLSVAVSPGGHC